jgi:hypothetical protein
MLGALFMAVVGVDRQWQFAITYSNGQPVETFRVLGGCGAKVVSEHPSGVISNNRKDVPSQLFSSLS